MFLVLSAVTMLVCSNLKLEHGGVADFVWLIVVGMAGMIALLGILFIRWAFAEEG